MNNFFVENCFSLTPRDVLRNFFREHRLGNNIIDDRRADIVYHFDDPRDPTFLFIAVGGQKPQAVGWEFREITFGLRSYFRCRCGARVQRIYLPPNSTEFKCKECHKLRYQLEAINSSSIAGKAIHRFIKTQKLADRRTQISRIFYAGRYTKRFESFLGLCARSGLFEAVNDAKKLMTLVKAQ
jgi:hypothetical protein